MLSHCFSSELDIIKHSLFRYQKGKEGGILNTVYVQWTIASSPVSPHLNDYGITMLCSSGSVTIILVICCNLSVFVFLVALA